MNLIEHMSSVLSAAREHGIRVFYVPSHRAADGEYMTWRFLSASQRSTRDNKTFARGTWGGEFRSDLAPAPADVIAVEHWGSSGFANTDLDFLLKQHAVSRVVFIGVRANTCIDMSARFAQELGYHVTLLRDAIAAFSEDEMRATLEIDAPNYSHAILTTAQFLDSIA